jgi:hypothetical protein
MRGDPRRGLAGNAYIGQLLQIHRRRIDVGHLLPTPRRSSFDAHTKSRYMLRYKVDGARVLFGHVPHQAAERLLTFTVLFLAAKRST